MEAENDSIYPNGYLYRRLVKAKLFIDDHFTESIDLTNISDEAHFSKFHFIRLFKRIYGHTPHQYLVSVRIKRARELLQQGRAVTDVCSSVGFESLSSFSALFKRSVGLIPSVYAARHEDLRKQVKAAPLGFIPGCFAEKHGWKK